jgi:broad specificity phosphatase PhoE
VKLEKHTVLSLVRHGQTSANIDSVWHGWTDTPLTPLGLRQAEQVARFLAKQSPAATIVYSSPLERARHTAQAIAERLELEVRIEADLREYDIGDWEGKTFKELHEVHDLWQHIGTDLDFAPHGGESPRRVVERFTACLRRIGRDHPNQRVITVAHGGALALALGELLNPGSAEWHRVMDNCAVSELTLEPEPKLLSFNLKEHLEGLRA